MGLATRAKFIPGNSGELFVFEMIPTCTIAGTVLIVPPFAEEMNRSRRMTSLQARQLALRGYRTLVPDLFGTGDSAGDFSDARWEIWRNDLTSVVAATNFYGDGPTSILALRLGALLAMDALFRGELRADNLVLWNPCVSGKQFMTQFLRMRIMSSMMSKTASSETVASLRQVSQQGDTVEVAGYTLAPDLISRIDALNLLDLVPAKSIPIDWFEVVGVEGRPFPVHANGLVDALVNDGSRIQKRTVFGPPFWATAEIAVCSELLSATSLLFART